MNAFLIFRHFVWSKEERLTLHQFQRQLAILMMFNTYDIEEGEEMEQTHQRQSKRNRHEVPDAHKLMVAPPHAKYYVGKLTYKWDLTASQKYQQLVCSTGCGTKTQIYCACNRYNWICKHCHIIKHVLTAHSGDNGNSSSQNSWKNSRKCVKKTKIQKIPKMKTREPNPQATYGNHTI